MSEIRFKASIAQTQSALKFGSKIGRITLEVPESEIERAVGLIALQETPLEVVIRVDESHSKTKDATKRTWPQIQADG